MDYKLILYKNFYFIKMSYRQGCFLRSKLLSRMKTADTAVLWMRIDSLIEPSPFPLKCFKQHSYKINLARLYFCFHSAFTRITILFPVRNFASRVQHGGEYEIRFWRRMSSVKHLSLPILSKRAVITRSLRTFHVYRKKVPLKRNRLYEQTVINNHLMISPNQ